MKPFKPPALVSRPAGPSQQRTSSFEPPLKKRRISHEPDDNDREVVTAAANILKQPKPFVKFQAPARKPLEILPNPSGSSQGSSQAEVGGEGYYAVLW